MKMKTHLPLFALGIALWASPLAQAQDTPDWPVIFTSGEYQLQVFKPQPESFDGTSFTARAAAALQRPQDQTPIFGALWGSGTLAIDRADRMGKLSAFKVTDIRFPGITDATEQANVKDALGTGILANAPPISIDWLVAALEEEKQSSASYDNTPPQIIYRDKPAMFLFVDGEPIFNEVKNDASAGDGVYAANQPKVERVVNTPYFLVRTNNKLWLYGSGLWYTADAVKGPWQNKTSAPNYLESLAQQVDSTYGQKRSDNLVPEVVYSDKPAVLLDINGAPQMQPYDNSSLMYVTNTDKDLFLYIPTQEYYLLASGRWYATADLRNGPWRFVAPDALPASFAKVPEGSAKDGILAHVPGTNAAREAVRDAAIPQTAKVDRRTARVQVSYDGDPQFQQIAGTSVYSAINASTTVLRINGVYYVVDNAVWYEGTSPDGPWTVSTAVPSQVNDIPPSDPAYKVRYVYIYDYTPDYVFTGYTPGYLGSYVQGGVLIYGTGYYYRPWRGYYWYPRPYTWGFNMVYNPWYGWGFGATWGYNWFYPGWNYYGYYRPYAWGWWGPYGYCPPVATWYGYGYHGHGPDGRGGFYGHRPSLSASTAGTGRPIAGAAVTAKRTDLYRNHLVEGVAPTVVADRPMARTPATGVKSDEGSRPVRTMERMKDDHFTDRQGNVYRNQDGRTEEFKDRRWESVRTPNDQGDRGGTVRPGTDSKAPVQRDRTATPGRDQGTVPPVERDRGQAPVQREPASNDRGTAQPQRTPAPDVRPAPQQPRERYQSPSNIQRDRMRGEQRTNEYKGYQQDRGIQQQRTPQMQQRAPQPQRAPQMQQPQRAPQIQRAPSAPRPAAPSGGGSQGGRRPR